MTVQYIMYLSFVDDVIFSHNGYLHAGTSAQMMFKYTSKYENTRN